MGKKTCLVGWSISVNAVNVQNPDVRNTGLVQNPDAILPIGCVKSVHIRIFIVFMQPPALASTSLDHF